MIAPEQIDAYVAGQMSADERARFEEKLLRDPAALRDVVAHERLDSGLRMLLARPARERVRASILAAVQGDSAAVVKAHVLDAVQAEPARHPRRTGWWGAVKEFFNLRPALAWSGAALAAAVIVLGILLSGRGTRNEFAMLADARMVSTVQRDGRELPAAATIRLQPADSISTRGDGAAVRFSDGTRLVLAANTTVRLAGTNGRSIELGAGRLFAEVAKQPPGRHVILRTPLARITVHGTAFELEAAPRLTRLDVTEGLVRMAHNNQDSELELAGGEFALAMPGRDLVGGLQPVSGRDSSPAQKAGDRDPAAWPFASDSPWNTAISSGAKFAAVQSAALDLAGRGLAVQPAANDRALFIARATDPEVPVLRRFGPGEFARLRLPVEALRNAGRPLNCTVLDPQLGLAHELIMAGRAGAGVEAMLCYTNPIEGSGVPPHQFGHTFSGLPLMAGIIRDGEMRRGIPHVLAGAVIHPGLTRAGAGGATFVWPARHVPMDSRKLDAITNSGNIHFGTLLAIPPDVDVRRLGLGTNGPAFELARALQDYGVHVTHSFGPAPDDGQGWRQPHLQLFADGLSNDELRAVSRDVAGLAGLLRVVSNNGPRNIGGGGTPRRPAPAGFQSRP
jgi:hypothetical protein